MANQAQALALDEADREDLQRLQRSPSPASGLSRRARAVLLMVDQVAGTEIARLTGYTPVQVSRIRRRFSTGGSRGCRCHLARVGPTRSPTRKALGLLP